MTKEELNERKKKCGTSDNVETIDRISELPECIVHHIYSFLSTEAVAQTSILSKTWRAIRASYPNLDFDQGLFFPLFRTTKTELSLADKLRKEEKRMRRGKEFMKYGDKTMQRFCEHKLCMQKFNLCMGIDELDHISRVDKWIELAIRKSVREVNVNITLPNSRKYSLAEEIFACKSITVLKLSNCELKGTISKSAINLPSLQKLCLKNVVVDEKLSVQDLFLSCSLIVHLSVKECEGLKNLYISGLEKLKILKLVVLKKELERVVIEAPSLESLTLGGDDDLVKILNIFTGKELKTLTLKEVAYEQFLYDLMSKYPLVETLRLENCNFPESLKISSHYLKSLRIKDCDMLESLNISSDHLKSFEIDDCFSLESLNISCHHLTSFEITECAELKMLDVLSHYVENLRIDSCGGLERLNISSDHLQGLAIYNCDMLKRFNISSHYEILEFCGIDIPNLLSFDYDGNILSGFFNISVPCQWKLRLDLDLNPLLFQNLKLFVQGNKIKDLILSIHSGKILPNIGDELMPKPSTISPCCEVEHLSLGIVTSESSYADILDGMFSICHPKFLTVASWVESANQFIKFLCENLMDCKNPNCYSKSEHKCWRQYLKDVNIFRIEKAEEDDPYYGITHLNNKWKIPKDLLKQRPLPWNTLLNALPKLEGASIIFALDWINQD